MHPYFNRLPGNSPFDHSHPEQNSPQPPSQAILQSFREMGSQDANSSQSLTSRVSVRTENSHERAISRIYSDLEARRPALIWQPYRCRKLIFEAYLCRLVDAVGLPGMHRTMQSWINTISNTPQMVSTFTFFVEALLAFSEDRSEIASVMENFINQNANYIMNGFSHLLQHRENPSAYKPIFQFCKEASSLELISMFSICMIWIQKGDSLVEQLKIFDELKNKYNNAVLLNSSYHMREQLISLKGEMRLNLLIASNYFPALTNYSEFFQLCALLFENAQGYESEMVLTIAVEKPEIFLPLLKWLAPLLRSHIPAHLRDIFIKIYFAVDQKFRTEEVFFNIKKILSPYENSQELFKSDPKRAKLVWNSIIDILKRCYNNYFCERTAFFSSSLDLSILAEMLVVVNDLPHYHLNQTIFDCMTKLFGFFHYKTQLLELKVYVYQALELYGPAYIVTIVDLLKKIPNTANYVDYFLMLSALCPSDLEREDILEQLEIWHYKVSPAHKVKVMDYLANVRLRHRFDFLSSVHPLFNREEYNLFDYYYNYFLAIFQITPPLFITEILEHIKNHPALREPTIKSIDEIVAYLVKIAPHLKQVWHSYYVERIVSCDSIAERMLIVSLWLNSPVKDFVLSDENHFFADMLGLKGEERISFLKETPLFNPSNIAQNEYAILVMLIVFIPFQNLSKELLLMMHHFLKKDDISSSIKNMTRFHLYLSRVYDMELIRFTLKVLAEKENTISIVEDFDREMETYIVASQLTAELREKFFPILVMFVNKQCEIYPLLALYLLPPEERVKLYNLYCENPHCLHEKNLDGILDLVFDQNPGLVEDSFFYIFNKFHHTLDWFRDKFLSSFVVNYYSNYEDLISSEEMAILSYFVHIHDISSQTSVNHPHVLYTHLLYQPAKPLIILPFTAHGQLSLKPLKPFVEANQSITFSQFKLFLNDNENRITQSQLELLGEQTLQNLLASEVAELGEKNELEEMLNNFLYDDYLNGLWIKKEGEDCVLTEHQIRFYIMMKHLFSQCDTVFVNRGVSDRQMTLIRMAHSIQACHAGKQEGMALYFQALVKDDLVNFNFTNIESLSCKKLHQYIFDKIMELLNNDQFILKALSFTTISAVPQGVHQTLFIKNILLTRLGLNIPIQFDIHSHCVMEELAQMAQDEQLFTNLVWTFKGDFTPTYLIEGLDKILHELQTQMQTLELQIQENEMTIYNHLKSNPDYLLIEEQITRLQVTERALVEKLSLMQSINSFHINNQRDDIFNELKKIRGDLQQALQFQEKVELGSDVYLNLNAENQQLQEEIDSIQSKLYEYGFENTDCTGRTILIREGYLMVN